MEQLPQEEKDKMLKDMHRALVGDPFDQDNHPGLVKTVNSLRDDMNGTKHQPMGIRQKVEKLWENQNKAIIIGSCVTAIVGGVVGVGAWLLPIIIKH